MVITLKIFRDPIPILALSLLRFAVEPNIQKDPLEMRLGKPRGGGGTVTSRVTPARHDLKGNQRHR